MLRWTSSSCTLTFQELAQVSGHKMFGQNVFDTGFECIPPEFRRTRRSREHYWRTDIDTSHSFYEIPPVAIGKGEFRDDHGSLAGRVEQVNRRTDAVRPLDCKSAGFDLQCDGDTWPPVRHENDRS